MVLFGTDYMDNNIFPKKSSKNTEHNLVVTTNEITNDILQMINTDTTKSIVFDVPIKYGPKRDITFDFKVDLWEWNSFVRKIEYLEFRGQIVNNQLTAKHFEEMKYIRGLYIGSTNYALFDNEDISNLPMIPHFSFNGYGLVIRSENMNKWMEKLKLNGCGYVAYI